MVLVSDRPPPGEGPGPGNPPATREMRERLPRPVSRPKSPWRLELSRLPCLDSEMGLCPGSLKMDHMTFIGYLIGYLID